MDKAEKRLDMFLGKPAETGVDRIVKAFVKDYGKIGTPIYSLDENGNVSGSLFISSDYPEGWVGNIISAVAPGLNVELAAGQFYTKERTYPGFWVNI